VIKLVVDRLDDQSAINVRILEALKTTTTTTTKVHPNVEYS
jgi:hypothetical protein